MASLDEDELTSDGFTDLLKAVEKLEDDFDNRREDIEFLKTFIASDDFKTLMKAHEAVKIVEAKPEPAHDMLTLSRMVSYDVEEDKSREACELYELLSSPIINSVLTSYDKVVNSDYPLQSVSPDEILEYEQYHEGLQTVRLYKTPREKIGATVKSDSAGNILIGRIIHGMLADKCGLLHPGDVIHEINNNNLQGMTIDDVGDLMRSLEGHIEFKVSTNQQFLLPQRRKQEAKHMKALFSYNPQQDNLLPCKEAGLQFNERDILVVFDQDDPEWWQANKIDERIPKVGLIPSSKLRERKYYEEAMTMTHNKNGRKKSKKNKKEADYSPAHSEELGGREIASYEEVVLLQPQRMQPRPIVLIAPRCNPFSVTDVSAKLIFSDDQLFGRPVQHTSRPPRTGEVHGKHYYYTTREEMRQKIRTNQFIEYEEHSGHYYGLMINTVRSVINQGKVALLTISPKTLKVLHQSAELKPYVVFFTMPSDVDINQYWMEKRFVDQRELPGVRRKTDQLASIYGQYFDCIVPYTDSDGATIEVQRLTNHLLDNLQWIPKAWVAYH